MHEIPRQGPVKGRNCENTAFPTPWTLGDSLNSCNKSTDNVPAERESSWLLGKVPSKTGMTQCEGE